MRSTLVLPNDRAARLRRPLDAARDPIVSFDADGVVREWNAAAETLFGHARADAVGNDLAELIVPREARTDFAPPSVDLMMRAGVTTFSIRTPSAVRGRVGVIGPTS